MVELEDLHFCGRLIPPGEEHYRLPNRLLTGVANSRWEPITFGSLMSYCAETTPDRFKTCEMCMQCVRKNGILW